MLLAVGALPDDSNAWALCGVCCWARAALQAGVGAGTELYEIERIIAKRVRVQYLVQWKGLPIEEATWESESSIPKAVVQVFDVGSSLTELNPPRRKIAPSAAPAVRPTVRSTFGAGASAEADRVRSRAGNEASEDDERPVDRSEARSGEASRKRRASSPPGVTADSKRRTATNAAAAASAAPRQITITASDPTTRRVSVTVEAHASMRTLRSAIDAAFLAEHNVDCSDYKVTLDGETLPMTGMVSALLTHMSALVLIPNNLDLFDIPLPNGEVLRLAVSESQRQHLLALTPQQRQRFAELQKQIVASS